jgi:3-deoxy-D-manno-octulosonic-acid transferase
MQRVLYSLLLRLALPLQMLRFGWFGWRNPIYRGSLRAHLALSLIARTDRPLWLHAASLGEVQALALLVERLRVQYSDQPLIITVGTEPGLELARQRFAKHLAGRIAAPAEELPALELLAAPWDLPGATQRFIAAKLPCAAVFIETELWPNLLQQASRAKIPLLLVSARVSARSARRYTRWMASLMRDTLRVFTRIGAQTAADRERFIAMGAEPDVVECWGNLKFDCLPPPDTPEQGRLLRNRLAAGRAMWVAGSTHAGEEVACLDAQQALETEARARGELAPLLVIAPRRPERFEEVARLIAARGFSLARHSAPVAGQSAQVLLLDCMGELLPYYAASDLAFVGGTLVPVGGHNLLEPAALARPVLAGAHTDNAPEAAMRLEAAGGLIRVADARALTTAVRELLRDPALAQRTGEAAAAIVAANGGATTRALVAITAVLPARPGWAAAKDPRGQSASG